MRDVVDELIWDEAPKQASAVAVFDAPELVADALTLTPDVRVFCDDWRDASLVDPDLLVEHPDDLHGVDVALSRLPKSLAALDEQAAAVQGAPDVTFVGGARIKHMNRSMNEVLNKHFAAVAASLGRSKSRVLRAWGPENQESDWPKVRMHEDFGFAVAAHGYTFGGTKIDPGSRLLMMALAGGGRTPGLEADDVLDFGCGNGTLSMRLAKDGLNVSARDVSWSAVAGTSVAAEVNGLEVDASWGAGLDGFEDDSFDAIVTNPPFHQGVAKDTTDTLAMFDDAARVLRPGGQLWCVFNSHLPYRRELNVRLGQTQVAAQDPNFTVTVTTLR
ncbi:class I SAM-dependent methyltransferase [Tessaracoccus lacteus]|uniref:Methyltransferase n=1 Tax=Tessaracoccus lacteus TaxID=3041766 RepID=A0ABY8PYK7_9ACTN|nr:methyltransferase [Tessaracoccus sp. T21]WGT47589.1 methyltransferase [Tessaracoccus sp. T21]